MASVWEYAEIARRSHAGRFWRRSRERWFLPTLLTAALSVAASGFSNPARADQFNTNLNEMMRAIRAEDLERIDALVADPYTLFKGPGGKINPRQVGGCSSFLETSMELDKPRAFEHFISLGVDLNGPGDPNCKLPRIIDSAISQSSKYGSYVDRLIADGVNLNAESAPGGSFFYLTRTMGGYRTPAELAQTRDKLLAQGADITIIGWASDSAIRPGYSIGIAEDITRNLIPRASHDTQLMHGLEELITESDASVTDTDGYRAIDFTCATKINTFDPIRAQMTAEFQKLLLAKGSPPPRCASPGQGR